MPLCSEKTFLHDYLYSLEVCRNCQRVISFAPNAFRCPPCMQALDLVWKVWTQCRKDKNWEGDAILRRVWQHLYQPPKNDLTPPL